jgi:hypothetical protein
MQQQIADLVRRGELSDTCSAASRLQPPVNTASRMNTGAPPRTTGRSSSRPPRSVCCRGSGTRPPVRRRNRSSSRSTNCRSGSERKRRQLHRKGQAVEPAADVVDHRAVVVVDGEVGTNRPTTIVEHRHRGVEIESTDRDENLAWYRECLAARGHEAKVRHPTRQGLGQRGRFRDHVLAIVENDDQLTISEMTRELIDDWIGEAFRFSRGEVADAQCGVHRGRHAVAVAHGCQLDEPRAVAELRL